MSTSSSKPVYGFRSMAATSVVVQTAHFQLQGPQEGIALRTNCPKNCRRVAERATCICYDGLDWPAESCILCSKKAENYNLEYTRLHVDLGADI